MDEGFHWHTSISAVDSSQKIEILSWPVIDVNLSVFISIYYDQNVPVS